ncbi:MAG: protein-L-isoaspartate(D-aspartate) O-methyltransferase [Phycisphaerae bacterium]|nr:protein-L-isoaspartate(D-aspartate) O-methyltransferase [Phycisphaerae bacterium]
MAETNSWPKPRTDERITDRCEMVRVIRDLYGVRDEKVLAAMEAVPRHWFVPEGQKANAYDDRPLPIGYEQTISQPLIVAFMTDLLELSADQKVLEIGTGSGYQAAILYEFTSQVYSIEIVRPLAERTIGVLKQHGYDSIRVKIGDGYQGWAEYAPYDAIIVTCAPDHIPPALKQQLRPGGRMVIPVDDSDSGQDLILIRKDADGNFRLESKMPVRFVPMTRERGS